MGCPDYVRQQKTTNIETELLSKFSKATLRNLERGILERSATESYDSATKIAYEDGRLWEDATVKPHKICTKRLRSGKKRVSFLLHRLRSCALVSLDVRFRAGI
jgi:hypothetical protein